MPVQLHSCGPPRLHWLAFCNRVFQSLMVRPTIPCLCPQSVARLAKGPGHPSSGGVLEHSVRTSYGQLVERQAVAVAGRPWATADSVPIRGRELDRQPTCSAAANVGRLRVRPEKDGVYGAHATRGYDERRAAAGRLGYLDQVARPQHGRYM